MAISETLALAENGLEDVFYVQSLKLAKFTSLNDYWVIINCCAFVLKKLTPPLVRGF